MAKKNIFVTKSSGEKAAYELTKLYNSLKKSGAEEEVVKEVIDEVEANLYDKITTKEIYKRVFGLLRKKTKPTAARYKLKTAIQELGPSGFPFEKFVAAILEAQGYHTTTNIITEGACVSHEIDVLAQKGNYNWIIECKFHNTKDKALDVKVPLYINSRFLDIEKQWKKHPKNEGKEYQGGIFTNTKFTSDAIQYGTCAGLKLVGWNYPQRGNLKDLIDDSGLHPITCLTTLTLQEKQKLLEAGNVLCKELYHNFKLLEGLNLTQNRKKKIIGETRSLCNI